MFNPAPADRLLDEQWMRLALAAAAEAGAAGEVPVGAVVVVDGQLAGTGSNRTRRDGIVQAHAELVALAQAERALGDYRLDGAELYVTLEPCLMCLGAIHQARVARVVYGAPEPKFGAVGSRFDLASHEALRRLTITGGVLAEEAAALLTLFLLACAKANGMIASFKSILGLLAVWALPWAVHAAALPYPALAWEQFPERQWSLQQLDAVALYPDWDPSAFKFETYQETEQNFGAYYGVAACQVYDPLLIAVVYYCTDGRVYLAQEPLQLVAGQRITITWRLPVQDAGVSRLLLLAQQPSSADWTAMLANPVKPTGPVKHLVAEQWLGRQAPQYTRLPWESPLRATPDPPAGFMYGSWPTCRAWLEPDLNLASKDCWVKTTCPANFSIDEFGPAGRWQLDWSNEFSFGYQLAPGPVASAVILLTGRVKADFTGAATPRVELEINGWRVDTPAEQLLSSSGLQQYYADVSQYIQAGWNTSTVRLNAVGGGILQMESVELWVR